MPYGSDLAEWKSAKAKKRRALLFKLMKLSGIQVHQGPHSRKNEYGVGIMPYKARVAEYLDKIDEKGSSHFAQPKPCGDCTSNKGKYPPRDNTVSFVDRASTLIEKDINLCLIFVSRIAAEFALEVGFDE
jgi:hypothetical protein